jgi:hypothetical protein
MRRGRIWILTLIAIASLVVVILTITVSAPVPFDFLSGQVPLNTPNLRREADDCTKDGLECTTFTFRADIRSLTAAIDAELRLAGYEPVPFRWDSQELIYMSPGLFSRRPSPVVGPPSTAPHQMVTVLTNHRYEEDRLRAYDVPEPHEDKGWITVSVRRAPAPSVFSHFREWLGL